MPVLIALSTCPDEPTARKISEALVCEGLAACVNQVPGVQSTYFWDGRLKTDAEILLIIKTVQDRLPEIAARLAALHPYELPELVAFPASGGNEGYLEWVRTSVRTKAKD